MGVPPRAVRWGAWRERNAAGESAEVGAYKVNQIEHVIAKLARQPFTRQAQMITWMPNLDLDCYDPPCLQSLWYRMLEDSDGKWLEGRDPKALNDSLRSLRDVIPQEGTSIENAFAVIERMVPAPDNVIIVTDGLPTQGAAPPPFRKTIDGDGRLRLFERAFGRYPKNIPLNVILFPMEGDPNAASAFWVASRRTGGAFMSPSKDWP